MINYNYSALQMGDVIELDGLRIRLNATTEPANGNHNNITLIVGIRDENHELLSIHPEEIISSNPRRSEPPRDPGFFYATAEPTGQRIIRRLVEEGYLIEETQNLVVDGNPVTLRPIYHFTQRGEELFQQ